MMSYSVWLHNGLREYFYHNLDLRESFEYLGNLMNALKGIKRTLYDIKDYESYLPEQSPVPLENNGGAFERRLPYDYKYWLDEVYMIMDQCLELEEVVYEMFFKYNDGVNVNWKFRGTGADLTKNDSYVIIQLHNVGWFTISGHLVIIEDGGGVSVMDNLAGFNYARETIRIFS